MAASRVTVHFPCPVERVWQTVTDLMNTAWRGDLARVEILGTFSMGRLLAAVGVMLAARKGVGEGVLAGACAGVALDLASGEQPYYSMVFALAGLACGLCKLSRKTVAALVHLLSCFVAGLCSLVGGLNVGLPM